MTKYESLLSNLELMFIDDVFERGGLNEIYENEYYYNLDAMIEIYNFISKLLSTLQKKSETPFNYDTESIENGCLFNVMNEDYIIISLCVYCEKRKSKEVSLNNEYWVIDYKTTYYE